MIIDPQTLKDIRQWLTILGGVQIAMCFGMAYLVLRLGKFISGTQNGDSKR